MEKTESIKELTAALAKAQGSFLQVKQTSHVDFQTTAGRKKYDYAPLSEVFDAVRKALSDNGLAVLQPIKMVERIMVVETLISHSSGEWIKGEIVIEPKALDPQSIGAVLTYARRYALSAMLGVASEEDIDGEQAEKKATSSTETEAPTENQHWCAEHKTKFFMSGKMKSFAHPIGDTGEWCHEHKKKDGEGVITETVKALFGEAKTEVVKEPTPVEQTVATEAPVKAVIKSLGDFYSECLKRWPKSFPTRTAVLKEIGKLESQITDPQAEFDTLAAVRK